MYRREVPASVSPNNPFQPALFTDFRPSPIIVTTLASRIFAHSMRQTEDGRNGGMRQSFDSFGGVAREACVCVCVPKPSVSFRRVVGTV